MSAALSDRLRAYLADRHTMTIATAGPQGPHAATVYYVLDRGLDLLFVSKGSSRHAREIAESGRVAVTVTDSDQHWREIQGVQLWGRAKTLHGPRRLRALAHYVRRFPFAGEIAGSGSATRLLDEMEVFRVEVERAAFVDNRTGLFGREEFEVRR